MCQNRRPTEHWISIISSGDYKNHLRLLGLVQVVNLVMIVCYLLYVQNNSEEIERIQTLNVKLKELYDQSQTRRIKRAVETVDINDLAADEETSTTKQWYWLSKATRIEKGTLRSYCTQIHEFCGDRGRKLRGTPGRDGGRGKQGPLGKKGKPGEAGARGEQGAPGDIGTPGRDGLDGECYCRRPTTTRVMVPTTEPLTTPYDGSRYTGPPTLGPNHKRCYLTGVGIPTQHAVSQFGSVGAWMRDSKPTTKTWEDRFWVTKGFAGASIHQYKNDKMLMKKVQETPYFINHRFSGTGLIVRAGMLYYHQAGSATIVRYDLENARDGTSRKVDNFAFQDCALEEEHVLRRQDRNCSFNESEAYLYNISNNFADFAADDNGVWLMLHYQRQNTMTVLKLDEDSLETAAEWQLENTMINETGNAFVICGVVYTIDDRHASRTKISYAYDLYENKEYEVNINWRNPTKNTTMVDYNPKDDRIYFYDNGSLLSAPTRVTERPGPGWKLVKLTDN